MKRLFLLPVVLVLLFAQCKKEEPLNVTYSVREDSQDQPQFTMTYTSDASGATAIAASSANYWNSSSLPLERGQFISLKVDCTAPLYDIVLRIYVNGYLWQEKQMHNPTSSATISGRLGE